MGLSEGVVILSEASSVLGWETWACHVCGQHGNGPMPAGHGLSHDYIDGGGI